jgi:hypothetical protein
MMTKVQFPLETSNFARAHKDFWGSDVQAYSSRYLTPPPLVYLLNMPYSISSEPMYLHT